MPHVIVKPWPGRSAEQKQRLTEIMARGAADVLGKWPNFTKQPGYGWQLTDQG